MYHRIQTKILIFLLAALGLFFIQCDEKNPTGSTYIRSLGYSEKVVDTLSLNESVISSIEYSRIVPDFSYGKILFLGQWENVSSRMMLRFRMGRSILDSLSNLEAVELAFTVDPVYGNTTGDFSAVCALSSWGRDSASCQMNLSGVVSDTVSMGWAGDSGRITFHLDVTTIKSEIDKAFDPLECPDSLLSLEVFSPATASFMQRLTSRHGSFPRNHQPQIRWIYSSQTDTLVSDSSTFFLSAPSPAVPRLSNLLADRMILNLDDIITDSVIASAGVLALATVHFQVDSSTLLKEKEGLDVRVIGKLGFDASADSTFFSDTVTSPAFEAVGGAGVTLNLTRLLQEAIHRVQDGERRGRNLKLGLSLSSGEVPWFVSFVPADSVRIQMIYTRE